MNHQAPPKNNNPPEPEHQEIKSMVSVKELYRHTETNLAWFEYFEREFSSELPRDTKERLESRIRTLVEFKKTLWEEL